MQPVKITDATIAFPARIDNLLVDYNKIPGEFKKHGNPYVKFQIKWFFHGLEDGDVIGVKDGINGIDASRHLHAIQQAFSIKHEHKMACVAYLASLWIDINEQFYNLQITEKNMNHHKAIIPVLQTVFNLEEKDLKEIICKVAEQSPSTLLNAVKVYDTKKQDIKPSDFFNITELVASNKSINAVKLLRELTNCGLADAKTVIDNIRILFERADS